VLVVVVSGRGELTVDGQVHQLAPVVIAHLPKGTVRAVEAVDGPLADLSVHRRRPAGLRWVGPPSDAEIPRGKPVGCVKAFMQLAGTRGASRRVDRVGVPCLAGP
jgi:hypothetical protein